MNRLLLIEKRDWSVSMTFKNLKKQAKSQIIKISPSKVSLKYIEKATADNTRQAYQSDIRHFELWGGKLPADTTTLVRYCEAHAESLNTRTLQRRLVAIRQFHHYQGFPDPTHHPLLKKTLRGIKNTHGKPKAQAAPLLYEHVEALINHLLPINTLASKRDIALITLGFAAGLRGRELLSVQAEHIEFETEGFILHIPRSKTDPTGEGQSCAVPKLGMNTCAFKAIKNWQTASGIQMGYLFRSVNRWQQLGENPMTLHGLNHVLRHWSNEIELPHANKVSSHSLRRGMATSASRAGASFKAIMHQGRWRHEGTVLQYIEEGRKFKDNAILSFVSPPSQKKSSD